MLNDIKIPPAIDPNKPDGAARSLGTTAQEPPKLAGVKPHEHIQPHVDPKAPGLHKPRIMGEAGTTDTIYAMPMEDRGSFFSLALSAVVVGVVGVLLISLWLVFR